MVGRIRKLVSRTLAGGRKVVLSSIIGQSVALVLTPILSRLYDPSAFGVLTTYIAVTTTIGTVAALRYDLAIPLPQSIRASQTVASLSIILTALVSLLSLLIVWMTIFYDMEPVSSLGASVWLIPIGILLLGLLSIGLGMAIRTKSFYRLSYARLAQPIGISVSQILFYPVGAIGLVAGQSLGVLIAAATVFRLTPRSSWARKLIVKLARRYQDFPKYSTPSALLNMGGLHISPLMIAGAFGLAAAGSFGIALRALSVPISVIGSALSQVYLANGVERHREGRLAEYSLRTIAITSILGAAFFVPILLKGPELFSIILGQDWSDAGRFAALMAPWLFFQLVWLPISNITIILELQKEALIAHTIEFSLRVSVLLTCIALHQDVTVTIGAYSFASGIAYALKLVWFLRRGNVPLLGPILLIISAVVLSVALPLIF